jgi:hypothetical protein
VVGLFVDWIGGIINIDVVAYCIRYVHAAGRGQVLNVYNDPRLGSLLHVLVVGGSVSTGAHLSTSGWAGRVVTLIGDDGKPITQAQTGMAVRIKVAFHSDCERSLRPLDAPIHFYALTESQQQLSKKERMYFDEIARKEAEDESDRCAMQERFPQFALTPSERDRFRLTSLFDRSKGSHYYIAEQLRLSGEGVTILEESDENQNEDEIDGEGESEGDDVDDEDEEETEVERIADSEYEDQSVVTSFGSKGVTNEQFADEFEEYEAGEGDEDGDGDSEDDEEDDIDPVVREQIDEYLQKHQGRLILKAQSGKIIHRSRLCLCLNCNVDCHQIWMWGPFKMPTMMQLRSIAILWLVTCRS